jgi:Recombinase zinc beta ribbon domain
VQAARAVNASFRDHGGGRSGRNNNLFRRLAKCAACGDRMHFIDKGRGRHPYFQCASAHDGLGCTNNKPIRYDRLEPVLLYHTRGLDARALLLDAGKKAYATARRQALEGEIGQLEREMDELIETMLRPENNSIKRKFEAKLRDREARQRGLEHELQQIIAQPDHREVEEHLASRSDHRPSAATAAHQSHDDP